VFRDINLARIFALNRIPPLAVAAILTLLVPAYCQQEVDPTWHDPWKTESNTIVHRPKQGRIDNRENRTRITPAVAVRNGKAELRQQVSRDGKRPKQLAAAK